jgi:hypothetical protein
MLVGGNMQRGLGGWSLRIFMFILGKLFDMAVCCLCYDLRKMKFGLTNRPRVHDRVSENVEQ